MAKQHTRQDRGDVEAFLARVTPATKREDARTLCALMERIAGCPPRMWGASMVGFGRYHYRYESGREGEAMLVGFSPRKISLTIYIMDGFSRHSKLMARLGRFSTGKSCLYVKRLDDLDRIVLEALIGDSVAYMRAKYRT